jgi:hypothetical protein
VALRAILRAQSVRVKYSRTLLGRAARAHVTPFPLCAREVDVAQANQVIGARTPCGCVRQECGQYRVGHARDDKLFHFRFLSSRLCALRLSRCNRRAMFLKKCKSLIYKLFKNRCARQSDNFRHIVPQFADFSWAVWVNLGLLHGHEKG